MAMIPSWMDPLWNYLYHALSALFCGYMLFRHVNRDTNRNLNGLPLPPGPKGYPLIGNLLDVPFYKPWIVYDEWFKTYGDMIYLNVFGMNILVLGSQKRATDLLDKRSLNYSDRMQLTMIVELMKWDFSFPVLSYDAAWRKHRKSFHEHFQPSAVSNYLFIQRREVHALLRRLLITPDNFLQHTRHTFAATVMDIAYGIRVQEFDDPYISRAEEAINGAIEAGVPGTFWVDFFPVLKYIPSWLPGAGFQKKAAHWRKLNTAVAEEPFDYVKKQLKNGTARPSMAAAFIERLPDESDHRRLEEETVARNVAAVAYLAGAETTISSVQALFLAMALYPEVQKKAQTEIDTVVGPNRLPEFEDRPFLPYIDAIVKESLRWHSVAPLGIPHMSSNEDAYDGYYIPKGTLVIPNAWSMLHNPKVYNDPMEFQPERYLKDGKLNADVIDPYSVAFGFGRRICPGRHLSSNSLYLIVSCLLAVYDIKPPVDDQGNAIELKFESTDGLASYPVPFKCVIKPRTCAAEALIRGSVNEDG